MMARIVFTTGVLIIMGYFIDTGAHTVGPILLWVGVTLAVIGTAALWGEYRKRKAEELKKAVDMFAATRNARKRLPVSPRTEVTRQQLTRLNVQRRIAGKPMLSPAGIRAAIVDAPAPSGVTSNDWLFYFLMWNAVDSSHMSSHEDIGTGVIIDNGPGGGAFGGAGASGSWTEAPFQAAQERADDAAKQPDPDPYKTLAVSALAMGQRDTFEIPPGMQAVRDDNGRATGAVEPAGFEGETRPAPSIADPSYSAPDPTPAPSYSAPDPSPSSSYDSGSSSGGGDSGGGGGGGGGD